MKCLNPKAARMAITTGMDMNMGTLRIMDRVMRTGLAATTITTIIKRCLIPA
jgi:hypothetical protein